MNLQYITDNKGNTKSIVIPIEDWENLKRKYIGIEEELEYTNPTKNEILEDIKEGLKEVNLIENKKLKGTPLKSFLDEL